MHLVCHENIPGTGYTRGEVVKNQAAIDEILSNPLLAKNFSQVPDGTFPSEPPSSPAPKPFSPAPPPASPSAPN